MQKLNSEELLIFYWASVEGLGRLESLIYLTASPAPLSLVPPPASTTNCSRGKYVYLIIAHHAHLVMFEVHMYHHV